MMFHDIAVNSKVNININIPHYQQSSLIIMSFYVPGCAETWQVKYYCPVKQQGPCDYGVSDMVSNTEY